MRALLISLSMAFVVLAGASPEAPPITTKILLRAPVSGDDSKEAIVVAAEFPPGSATRRHFHPGDEYATVLEGTLEILVDGQAPRRVSAGESYHNARGVIHMTKNDGAVPARAVSTFVIDKGEPIMKPVDGN